MRRLIALVILVALSLTLVACGGGGDEASDSDTEAAPAAAAPAAAAVDEDETPDLSPAEEQVYEPFPVDEEVPLPSIAERLDSGTAMIVYFYDDAQATADDQSDVIDLVMEDYRGLIDLVSFNIGEYVNTDELGTITVKEGLEDDETAQSVAKLMGDAYLDVRFTPYTILVDEDGYIVYRFRGFVDEKTLEREVLRATD